MESDLAFIKRCAEERKVYWTYHSNMRLGMRSVTRVMVLDSIRECEIIEEYPDDFPLPSCLCLGHYEDEPLHYVIGIDRVGDDIRIITVYRPDPLKWEKGFLKRRK